MRQLYITHHCLEGSGITVEEGMEETEEPESVGNYQQWRPLDTQLSCAYELTAVVRAHSRPVRVHTRPDPRREKGGGRACSSARGAMVTDSARRARSV